ncbi:MAG: cobalamin biosynthesis protein CbiX, partial [Ruegeria sp.]
MPHALIVAHGQPSDPAPAEAALADFARQVDSAAKRVSVHSATLATPSRLEEVLSKLPDETVIYPMFMANGWF